MIEFLSNLEIVREVHALAQRGLGPHAISRLLVSSSCPEQCQLPQPGLSLSSCPAAPQAPAGAGRELEWRTVSVRAFV